MRFLKPCFCYYCVIEESEIQSTGTQALNYTWKLYTTTFKSRKIIWIGKKCFVVMCKLETKPRKNKSLNSIMKIVY